MIEQESGFVRLTHRRCEDCDIRGDLHASGSPLPKRHHTIGSCGTCGGKGEIPLGLKDGLDPYRSRDLPRMVRYALRRTKRAYAERHRFRPRTRLEAECELLMQIPPGGFNHGRHKTEDGSWKPLESEGADGDVLWPPSFKRYAEPLRHGTRYAYQKARCRCFICRQWNARQRESERVATPIGRGQIISAQAYVGGVTHVPATGTQEAAAA